MNKQQVIRMIQEKQRKSLELTSQGLKSPVVLTPLETNQIITALVQPDVKKMRRQQELLRELTQIVSEQV